MKKLFLFVSLFAAVAATSCSYDDSELWDKVNNLETRVAALESNVSSLQTMVTSLNTKVYVTAVNQTANGYSIVFSDGKTATLTNGANGADGADGKTPAVSVAIDNGIYYWTVNGSWLTDANGNKIAVTGNDGTPGNDGLTPEFKIENGKWYVRYGSGEWSEVGQATGDSFFQSVTDGAESVTIVLADGTTIVLPKQSDKPLFAVAYAGSAVEGTVKLGSITFKQFEGEFVLDVNETNIAKSVVVETSGVVADAKVVTTADAKTVVFTLTAGRSFAGSISVLSLGTNGNGIITDIAVEVDKVTGNGSVTDKGGNVYNTALMADGKIWMVDNMRYIPQGVTVSSDPTENDAKIWYPCNADKTVDSTPEGVIAKGLLYSYELVLGVPVTGDNCQTLEGAQGICPDGWHIPTKVDFINLVGKGVGALADNTDAPYFSATTKKGSIALLNADGFNAVPYGYRNRSNNTTSSAASYVPGVAYNGNASMTQYAGSSWYQTVATSADDPTVKNIQFFGMQLFHNATNESAAVAYVNYCGGFPVRCVRNN